MSNEYYDHLNAPATGSQLSSAILRAELDKIETGFDKMPVLSTSANKLITVNSSGTAMVATDTPDINGGTIDGTAIGATVPAAGTFTNLAATTAVTVPTVAVDTSTTDAASTAFVLGQAASATPNMDGSAAAGASTRFARGDHVHPSDTSRAPTASPTFTGTATIPTAAVTTLTVATSGTAPTMAVDNNTTNIATTAFVLAQAASATSPMDGTAAVGTSTRFARADHVHPTDTTRAPVNNPTFTGTVTLAGDPASNLQAATKQYVDGIASGLDTHTACRVASTANIASLSGLLTIDGVTVIANDRVLVKDQTTNTQNGIYVAAAGAWTRATDADAVGELRQGSYVFVNEGTVNTKTGWTQATAGTITPGTTAITWNQFSSTQTYSAGTGLSLGGSTFSLSTPVAVANGGTGAATSAAAPFALKGANSDITSLTGLSTALTVAQGGSGAATLTGVLKGNGTAAFSAATGTDVTTLIGANAVTNATNSVNSGVTNDTTTNATMYPVWVTANTGNLPAKVTSTKLTFNPSTGMLTSTGFTGPLTGNASTATSATTATNVAGGVAGAVHWQSAAGTTGMTAAGTAGQALLSGGTTVPTWGTLGVAAGGTGGATAADARTNLGVPSTTGTGASGSWGISITGSAASATTATTATNVSGTVAVANGGTGGTTAALGRTGLGATTVGANMFTLVNPSAITFPRFNADNTVSALDAATFRTAIGAGSGSGDMVLASAQSVTGAKTFNSSALLMKGSGTGTTTFASANASVTNYTITFPASTGTVLTTAAAVTAAQGGTGQTSYAVGDLLYASAATTVSKLADVATGNALISGGVGVAPSYGKIGLTTHISGTLAVGNGGTGATTLTANNVLLGNGTSALQAVAPGSSGNVLTSNGTTWTSAAPVSSATDGNLVLLATVSPSGAVSASFAGQMSATYDTYIVRADNLTFGASSAAANFTLSGGAASTWSVSGINSGNTIVSYEVEICLRAADRNVGVFAKYFADGVFGTENPTVSVGGTNTRPTGITVASGANGMTGTIKLYGVKKA